jgi:hypothetical protein
LFKSGVDLSDLEINSSCETYSKMMYKKKNLYYFELKYFTECSDSSISIKNSKGQELYL